MTKPLTEHVYNITSILSKGTTLTFTDTKHHTITDGTTSKGVFLPTNAPKLEDNFAFDNSGLWKTDGNNGSLGQTYKSTIYCSVISLENGDKVRFDLTTNARLYAVNNVLTGIEAGEQLTSGKTYTINSPIGSTVNIDLKMTATSNRNGFTKITLWKSDSETTAIRQMNAQYSHTSKALYTLSGSRLTSLPAQGIYIKDGKKYFVR